MENNKKRTAIGAPPEQVGYANIVSYGAWLGIAIMLITYTIYLTEIIEPHIPLKDVPKYWSLPVHDYVHEAGIPVGWEWVSLLGKGDFVNFVGIALLAAMSIICFTAILLPAYIKQKNWIYVGIVVTEVLVLVLAASGILGAGEH